MEMFELPGDLTQYCFSLLHFNAPYVYVPAQHLFKLKRAMAGSNGLANPRDFQVPVAHFDSRERPVRLLHKLGGQLFQSRQASSPFNVVAWHGNYVPFKYDLRKFCPMNTVLFDHADPSIFTVLTCPSATTGEA